MGILPNKNNAGKGKVKNKVENLKEKAENQDNSEAEEIAEDCLEAVKNDNPIEVMELLSDLKKELE